MAKYVRICPRCGSTKITSFTGGSIDWIGDFKYRCYKCDYEGVMPEIKEHDIDKFRKELMNP